MTPDDEPVKAADETFCTCAFTVTNGVAEHHYDCRFAPHEPSGVGFRTLPFDFPAPAKLTSLTETERDCIAASRRRAICWWHLFRNECADAHTAIIDRLDARAVDDSERIASLVKNAEAYYVLVEELEAELAEAREQIARFRELCCFAGKPGDDPQRIAALRGETP